MDSGNFIRPPAGHPQALQSKQRKRARLQAFTPLIPSQELDMVNSSQVIQTGSTSQGAPPKSVYEAWTDGSEAQLFKWLQLPGNYERWKCAGIRNCNESMKTSGLTKKGVTIQISQFLDTMNTKKSPEQVMSKMRYLEKKFKEAEDYLRNTGEGLTSNDEKLGINNIREKVISICSFYFEMKPFMSENVVINPPYVAPPYVAETSMNENKEMLFGSSIGARLHESTAEEGDGNSEEGNASGNDGPEFEEEGFAHLEPMPKPPSQGTLLVPDTTQSKSTPNRQAKEKKRKPKSFEESLQEIQEQSHILMDKKLDIQLKHQQQKLQFLREQSQQQYALESRRLDLEFLRMEHLRESQREESRIRLLALQVELEKLRQ